MLRETCSILALHCYIVTVALVVSFQVRRTSLRLLAEDSALTSMSFPPSSSTITYRLIRGSIWPLSPHPTILLGQWSLHFGLLPLFRDVLFLLLTYRSGYPHPPIWPKYGFGQFGKYVCGLLALLAPTALVGGGGKWKFPGGKTSTRARGGAAQLADRFFGGRGWVVGGGWTEEYSAPALSRPLRALPGVGSDDPPTNPILSPPMWITAMHPMSCKIPFTIRFTCHLQELTIASFGVMTLGILFSMHLWSSLSLTQKS